MAEELLAEDLADVHHDIEGTLGLDAGDALDLVHALHHVIAALLKGLTHLLHGLLRGGESLGGSGLRDGAGRTSAVAQIVADHLGDGGGSGHVADTPASHGIGLGHAVDQQGAGLHVLTQSGEADKLLAVIGQAVVDLIGDDIDVLLHTDLGDLLQLLAAVHHAGGVGGVVEDHALGLGGDGSGELLRSDLEVLGLGSLHHHGHAAHHADELNVADPVRSRQDDLVAGVHQSAQSHIDAGLGAVGDSHLSGGVLHAAVLLQTLADGLAQGHGAHRRRILGVVILDGLDTNLLNVVGGGEIRLTGTKADDIQTIGLHLLEHGINGHGSGRLDSQCNPG